MDPAAVVAIVFALMFLTGVMVGVIAVMALPALRRRRPGPAGHEEDEDPVASGIPGHWTSGLPDDHPRWPGNTDSAR